jgi:hypothetical protein
MFSASWTAIDWRSAVGVNRDKYETNNYHGLLYIHFLRALVRSFTARLATHP